MEATTEVVGLERHLAIAAPRERAFDAIATLDGLRGWWTTIVGGSPAGGGELRFEFEGLDEHVLMRVDEARRPASVRWTCIVHTGQPEWSGTEVGFDLAHRGPRACELSFRHTGIAPEQVERGWDHFLDSLRALVERGEGKPFGNDQGDERTRVGNDR